jgi:plastocyanin
MSRVRQFVAFALSFGALNACGSDSTAPETPTGAHVTATASRTFDPASLTVTAGQSVTWVFQSLEHDVVFDAVAGAPSNIGLSHNKNVERTFSTAGSFHYICSVHNGMSGTIVVAAAP